MNFICSKESFIKILTICENVISTKNSILILSNVLIEAKGSSVKISAYDTTLSFFGEIGADVIQEGSISVYCNRLYSISKKLPGDEIEITTDDENLLTIKPTNSDNIHYNLKGIGADKFPPIKQIDDVSFFSVHQDIFTEMVSKTKFAVSITGSRRFVSGSLLEKKDDSIRMIATDGKRLAYIKKTIDIPEIESISVIVPPKVLQETTKLCSGNGDVQMAITDENIYIHIDNYYFISNLLDASFPPYEKVIPEDNDKMFKADKTLLFQAIDRISLIGDKEYHKIILSIDNNELKIHTTNATLGSGEEIIPVEYDGEKIQIALNYIYILEVLSVFKNEKVIIEFKNKESTITVREENNDDYICIMMPMSS